MSAGSRVFSATINIFISLVILNLLGCRYTDINRPAPLDITVDANREALAPDARMPLDANQRYELVAPIALFPDELLAEVLAGSAYPDQISAADNWLKQNRIFKGDALQKTIYQQPWDASVKVLTNFPAVLDNMAQNLSWISALGTSYASDPSGVMNAIQIMRQRAIASGALCSDARQRVSTLMPTHASLAEMAAAAAHHANPAHVPPPQTIVVEPVQAGIIYVPAYNPTVVYGMPMPLYPSYIYTPPAYDVLATGLVSFGVGIPWAQRSTVTTTGSGMPATQLRARDQSTAG